MLVTSRPAIVWGSYRRCSRHTLQVTCQDKRWPRKPLRKATGRISTQPKRENANSTDVVSTAKSNALPDAITPEELERIAAVPLEKTPPEVMAATNAYLASLAGELPWGPDQPVLHQAIRVDNRIPPFHEEFLQSARLPVLCDARQCYEKLQEDYEIARATPRNLMALLRPAVETYNIIDILGHRLRTTDMEVYKWFLTARPGDLRIREPESTYITDKFNSFGNVLNPADRLYPGTTHVAVGFLDLGGLAASCVRWQEDPSFMGRPPSAEAPLRWVGYDAAGYAAAKTEVVAQMMRGGAPTDDVLQVWYSAVWSRSALASFRGAISEVLAAGRDRLSEEVVACLQHWEGAEVSLEAARKLWFESGDGAHHAKEIANLTDEADRLAMCSYVLTGQLLEGEVGSVVMFAVPYEQWEREKFEFVLGVLDPISLASTRQRSAPDIISAAVELLRQRITLLGSHLAAGEITVEIRHRALEPEDTALHEEIRALQPRTMSWSNVCDYYHPARFHAMARACSAPSDTVHYLHSMNWTAAVIGSTALDYVFACNGKPEAAEVILREVKKAEASLKAIEDAVGWGNLLLSPPCTDFRRILDYSLATQYMQVWLRAFCEEGDLQLSSQVGVFHPPMYSPFNRSASTVFLTLSYDPSIDGRACLDGFGLGAMSTGLKW